MTTPAATSPAYLDHAGERLRMVDLPGGFGERLYQLPVVLRLLLENILRNSAGDERQAGIDAIFGWLEHRTSQAEIAFQPGRVLMHDTTSTPALVDIAAMRNALDEAGWQPALLNPGLPVDISVDHSLAVEFFGQRDAVERNLQLEMRRNRERYTFLRWASNVMQGVRIHPPGTGIMHTINLEQLATVVTTEERGGERWVVPDVMIGTDSHTPMINGIGVLGWGVGGLEAQTVMFGMPTMLRVPDVIGVRRSTPGRSRSTWTRSRSTSRAPNGRKTCWRIQRLPPRWRRSASRPQLRSPAQAPACRAIRWSSLPSPAAPTRPIRVCWSLRAWWRAARGRWA